MKNIKESFISELQKPTLNNTKSQIYMNDNEYVYSDVPDLFLHPSENIKTLLKYTNEVLNTSCCLYKSFTRHSTSIIDNEIQNQSIDFNVLIDSINSQIMYQENNTVFVIEDLNIINDKISDPLEHIHSNINISIYVQHKLIGILYIFDRKSRVFTNTEIKFMNNISEKIGIQQEHINFEKTHKVLNKISESIQENSNLDAIINNIKIGLDEIIDTKHFFLGIYDIKTDSFSYHKSYPKTKDESDITIQNSLAGIVIKSGKILSANHETIKEYRKTKNITFPGDLCKNWLGIPLIIHDNCIGILSVQSNEKENFHSVSDISILQSISTDIAQFINNNQKKDELTYDDNHLQYMYENAPLGMYRITPEGVIISANPAFIKILQYDSLTELQQYNLNSTDSNIHYNRDIFFKTLEKDGIVKNLESKWLTKNGDDVYIKENAKKNYTENGDVYIDGYIEDITSTKIDVLKLENSTKNYFKLFQNNADGIIIFNNDCSIKDINPEAISIFGISKEQIIDKKVEDLIPDKNISRLIRQKIIACYETEKQHIEVTLHSKDSDFFSLDLQFFNYDYFGEKSIVAFARDISKIKKYEKKIKTSFEEKQVLLKEIHHRVKNNLQLVSSLLSLQSHKINNEMVSRLFDETQERIRSIALIHESFYQSNDFSKIDFYSYVRQLVVRLTSTSELSSNKIQVHINICDIFLDINKAIPCGLIINELTLNSMTYAFPTDQKDSRLTISMDIKNRQYKLIIKDNGIGLPNRALINNESKTFGIELVKTLTKQLKGNITINNVNGTEYIITFPSF